MIRVISHSTISPSILTDLSVTAPDFQPAQQDVAVRTSVPIELKFVLQLQSVSMTVTVQGEGANLVETTPVAHTDVDRNLIDKLPIENQSIGLSEIVTNSSPSVAADANGFFHPWATTPRPRSRSTTSPSPTSTARSFPTNSRSMPSSRWRS